MKLKANLNMYRCHQTEEELKEHKKEYHESKQRTFKTMSKRIL
jgi:hypothetical protein